jgi:hypothetical protein
MVFSLEEVSAARSTLPPLVGWGAALVLPAGAALVGALVGWTAARFGIVAQGATDEAHRPALTRRPVLALLPLAPALLAGWVTARSVGPLSVLSPAAVGLLAALGAGLAAAWVASRVPGVEGEEEPELSAPVALGVSVALAVVLTQLPLFAWPWVTRQLVDSEKRAILVMGVTGASVDEIDQLGWMRLGRGEREGAYVCFRAAAALDRGSSSYPAHLSWSLAQAGRCDEAEPLAEEARRRALGKPGMHSEGPEEALRECRQRAAQAASASARPAASAPPVVVEGR